jgi:hypothetical protein
VSRRLSPDVGTRTSYALTEARTVLSRAETALYWLKRQQARDPDHEHIVLGLELAIAALAPYRRTGRAKK